MESLEYYLAKSIKERWAVPHFNISDLATLRGAALAAQKLKSPVMIGTSEGERAFIGLGAAVAIIPMIAKEFGVPLFLNADHSFSVETATKAMDSGYSSVHIDLSKKPWQENITGVTQIVTYAKTRSQPISIEGEAGFLVTDSSKIYKEAIEIPPESLTTPEQAKEFVETTGVDRFAPAVGTLHGIAANRKIIDIERIKEIRGAVGNEITLVLHGGSGTDDSQLKAAIEAGINCIHINTELRVAYSKALRLFLEQNEEETTPYKILEPAVQAVAQKVVEKIRVFGSDNKI